MLEAAVVLHQAIQHRLAAVAEGSVAEIVRQRDGLREVLIQPERPADIAGNSGNLDRVSQPRSQMVAGAVQEDLRLIFQAAKRAAVDDAVAVPLVFGAPCRRRLRVLAATGVGAELRVRSQAGPFERFQFLSGAGHALEEIPKSGIRTAAYYVASSCCTEMPRRSNSRRMASSIRLFGQDAPAVMPTVTFPEGSQLWVSISACLCWS